MSWERSLYSHSTERRRSTRDDDAPAARRRALISKMRVQCRGSNTITPPGSVNAKTSRWRRESIACRCTHRIAWPYMGDANPSTTPRNDTIRPPPMYRIDTHINDLRIRAMRGRFGPRQSSLATEYTPRGDVSSAPTSIAHALCPLSRFLRFLYVGFLRGQSRLLMLDACMSFRD